MIRSLFLVCHKYWPRTARVPAISTCGKSRDTMPNRMRTKPGEIVPVIPGRCNFTHEASTESEQYSSVLAKLSGRQKYKFCASPSQPTEATSRMKAFALRFALSVKAFGLRKSSMGLKAQFRYSP